MSIIDIIKIFVNIKLSLIFAIIAMSIHSSSAQYYLRGELKDEQGQPLSNIRIMLVSKGTYPYFTGSTGGFGLPTNLKIDTIVFMAPGFDTLKSAVITSQFNSFTMKYSKPSYNPNTVQLASYTKGMSRQINEGVVGDGETYSSTVENGFINTGKYPETGFALHVDRASYSNIRRFINEKERPPVDAVRIEEMMNYFNFRTKQEVQPNKTFAVNTNLTSCPWNEEGQLLFINLLAKKINLDKTPPSNFVFLIDVSGSMEPANRLPLLKSAFKLLVENLRAKDVISIVIYGDKVSVELEPTHGNEKQKIIEAIEGLTPDGSTPGASAIRTAYSLARNTFINGGNNRVIIATDGDFNVGESSEKALEVLIEQESKSGIYLTCLGVGMGNYKDSKLEALAKKGNGNFAYLDSEEEAEKVLVEEFAQTLYMVANDVYLSVNFDPKYVKEYRLIGFDNKKSAFADEKIDLKGGNIGSGHSILAAFEIIPQSSGISKVENAPVAKLELSYKLPSNDEKQKEQFVAAQNYQDLNRCDSCLRFASSVIMFGTFLKESAYSREFSWEDLASLASLSASKNSLLQMQFVDLVSKAKKLYPNIRRRKIIALQ